GEHEWVMTGTGILKAFDFSGKELWARDIQKDYGRFGLNWGYGSSPLLHADSLYVQVLHGMHTDDPSYLLRIDKATGKTVWRVERSTQARMESPDAYTTPALVRYGNTTQNVPTGGDVVHGHQPASGKEIYGRQRLKPGTYSGSFVLGDGKLYITNEDGVTSVVKAGPAFEILAENDFGEYTLSSPAISEGQIFIRTAAFLYCIGKRV